MLGKFYGNVFPNFLLVESKLVIFLKTSLLFLKGVFIGLYSFVEMAISKKVQTCTQ